MLMRKEIVYNGTEVIEIIMHDFTWEQVIPIRNAYLQGTDIFMIVDRYNTYTEEQQQELNEYRQALRDLTDYQDFDDETEGANDAVDNWPNPPEWMEL